MKTYSTKASDIKREWHVIDASGEVLGRLASRIAGLLQGKHKPIFVRNMDVGDYVVVINAEKIKLSGEKYRKKLYRHHTLYPGGFKEVPFEEMLGKHPTRVLEHAVKGMLPHNRIGADMMKKLRVYPGSEHPHESQVKAPEAGGGKENPENQPN